MHFLSAIAAISTLLSSDSGPQLPIAAGHLDGIVEVVRAGRDCGIEQFRIETRASTEWGEAQLYLLDEPSPQSLACLRSWTTRMGRQLHLRPRWHNDTFERDAP